MGNEALTTIDDDAFAEDDAFVIAAKSKASAWAPLYIFDLDGTIALNDHRKHLVEGPVKQWERFFAECVHDAPNVPVINTMAGLLMAGAEVRIWSGRSSEVMMETNQWLTNHLPIDLGQIELTMRLEGDHCPDDELKQLWLDSMPAFDRGRLVAVFDDRDSVVAMWRRNGVPCFQVAPGAF